MTSIILLTTISHSMTAYLKKKGSIDKNNYYFSYRLAERDYQYTIPRLQIYFIGISCLDVTSFHFIFLARNDIHIPVISYCWLVLISNLYY